MPSLSRLLAVVSLVGVVSCAALSQQADTTKYFVLTPLPEPTRSEPKTELTVGIGPVTIPDHLDERIVTRLSKEEVAISDNERWAEPLRDSLSAVLRQDLRVLLGTDRILAYPWRPSAAPNVAVAFELLHFERTTNGTVDVEARWTIRSGSAEVPVFTRSASIRGAYAGADARAAVVALNTAVTELSREIAADVTRAPVAYEQPSSPQAPRLDR
jgi:uncharacterized lipoprotein YmbA